MTAGGGNAAAAAADTESSPAAETIPAESMDAWPRSPARTCAARARTSRHSKFVSRAPSLSRLSCVSPEVHVRGRRPGPGFKSAAASGRSIDAVSCMVCRRPSAEFIGTRIACANSAESCTVRREPRFVPRCGAPPGGVLMAVAGLAQKSRWKTSRRSGPRLQATPGTKKGARQMRDLNIGL